MAKPPTSTSPEGSRSPAADLLTVIITTSVTPSAPSTELVEAVLQSFHRHSPVLASCRVIVTFDGYDQITARARLKKGQVAPEQAANFDLYKANVKALVLGEHYPGQMPTGFSCWKGEAEYGSPRIATNSVSFEASQTHDKRVTFIEPARRLGFGLAVRTALRMTATPYVFVAQHDWALVADIPVESMLHIMEASEADAEAPVKYVCLPAVRMLSYASQADVRDFPALRHLTATLRRDFVPPPPQGQKVPLTPLFFWHDKPHICSTAHYLATVFPSRLAMLRGDFIEDKIGQRARAQMKEGMWAKWACWLYYPDDGKQLCLRHLQGRTWRGAEAEADKVALYRAQRSAVVTAKLDAVPDL